MSTLCISATAPVIRENVVLYVNSKRYEIPPKEATPTRTLLDWLRSKGLTGTKLGCGEGGCGACTVLVSSLNNNSSSGNENGDVTHITVNACMMPVLAADLCHVTTVEGIGSVGKGLHPVQDRMVRFHGSQCGFCTPGIVMAMYGIFAADPETKVSSIEEHLDGNLCRCTGYRPIWDAAKSLCCDSKQQIQDIEDQACLNGCNGSSGCPGVCVKKSSTVDKCKSETTISHSPPAFPSELLSPPTAPLHYISEFNTHWWKPTSLEQLLEILHANPQSRLIVGNTEVGIETKFKNVDLPHAIYTSAIPELYSSSISDKVIRFGACLSLSKIQSMCKNHVDTSPVAFTIYNMLRWFASTQIRNVACLGGNLATASPISDMNPVLSATGASLVVKSQKGGERMVLVKDFFLSYRRVDLHPGEVIVEVIIPQCKEFEYVLPFKQARRREDDISIVTSCMRVVLKDNQDGFVIDDCAISFGGMAPTTTTAHKAMKVMMNKPFSRKTIEAGQAAILSQFDLPENVPGGQSQFRRTLASSFLFKFFVSVAASVRQDCAKRNIKTPTPEVSDEEVSAAKTFVTEPKPSIRGLQIYPEREQPGIGCEVDLPGPSTTNLPPPIGEKTSAAGVPKTHASGPQHTTGEAVYVDDIPDQQDGLYAAFIGSKYAGHGVKLGKIDATKALNMPGVFGVVTAEDVKALGGRNEIGPVKHDEEVFGTSELRHIGMPLGLVCANTHEQAVKAAEQVQVEYEFVEEGESGAIVSIEDAIKANSYFDVLHELEAGEDMDMLLSGAAKDDSMVVIEGEMKVGGQEHFYLETNSALVVPKEGGAELEVFASTQGPTHTQQDCAMASGLPFHKVVAKTKRMGGGFGGKETRSGYVAAAAAVAARRFGRPVKLTLDRNYDMQTSGQRHAFYVKYKAVAKYDSVSKSPQLYALDAELYSNGGCSLDLSIPVLDRAMFHIDGCYYWPNARTRGRVCKTNQAPHTAFRGFGGPQGILVGEVIMEHLSTEIGKKFPEFKGSSIADTTEKLRNLSFYKPGQSTHFGHRIEEGTFYIPRAWEELKVQADIKNRRRSCQNFNSANKWRKRGISMLPTKFGINFTAKFMNQGGSLVHVYQDGTVLVTHGGTEMGQGLHTKVAQVAAHAFNVPLSDVHVGSTATDKVANSNPTAASLSTDLYGMATLDACQQILQRLAPIRERLEKERGERVRLKDVATAAFFSRVDLSAHGYYKIPDDACGYNWDLPVRTDRGKPFNYYTQGVACSEVEVDVLTGDHRVLRTDIIMDVGVSINPAIDIGQIEGAFTQGMGWCTCEEIVWGDDSHSWVQPPARLFTAGPGTYKIPAFNDTPEVFNVTLLSGATNKVAVNSSKAVGEPPFFLGASVFFAIKDAIYAAREDVDLGNDYLDLYSPATSERIRMNCMDKFAKATTASSSFKALGSF